MSALWLLKEGGGLKHSHGVETLKVHQNEIGMMVVFDGTVQLFVFAVKKTTFHCGWLQFRSQCERVGLLVCVR
ncbi:hypothetical protein TSUD_350670 [Trifolium subterraneum]|uniref:Uncharacterized protein n=1 Tax=Trifolium subterraneum TaxID=3900 RepID=A0A2Z6PBD5_TRISU|nr:hypothetical protein TSUD_350670 [Trifolium subterraneum]